MAHDRLLEARQHVRAPFDRHIELLDASATTTCILAATIGVNLRAMDNSILAGLVVPIALAAKNTILIVVFAKQGEVSGLNRFDAAVEAARARLRPILITSFAFIFGGQSILRPGTRLRPMVEPL